MKYSLSTWEIPRVKPEGFPEGLRLYFALYPNLSHNTAIINLYSYTSSIVFPGRAILEELILHIALADEAIFNRPGVAGAVL